MRSYSFIVYSFLFSVFFDGCSRMAVPGFTGPGFRHRVIGCGPDRASVRRGGVAARSADCPCASDSVSGGPPERPWGRVAPRGQGRAAFPCRIGRHNKKGAASQEATPRRFQTLWGSVIPSKAPLELPWHWLRGRPCCTPSKRRRSIQPWKKRVSRCPQSRSPRPSRCARSDEIPSPM